MWGMTSKVWPQTRIIVHFPSKGGWNISFIGEDSIQGALQVAQFTRRKGNRCEEMLWALVLVLPFTMNCHNYQGGDYYGIDIVHECAILWMPVHERWRGDLVVWYRANLISWSFVLGFRQGVHIAFPFVTMQHTKSPWKWSHKPSWTAYNLISKPTTFSL